MFTNNFKFQVLKFIRSNQIKNMGRQFNFFILHNNFITHQGWCPFIGKIKKLKISE